MECVHSARESIGQQPNPYSLENRGNQPQTRGHLERSLVRKLHSWRKISKQVPKPLGVLGLSALMRGFLQDLHTALFRMASRIDRLPFGCWVEIGPAMQRGTTGNLLPCNYTLSCMSDIQNYEASHPEATEFDVETFRLGWKMGARSAFDNSGKTVTEEKA